MVLTTGLTPWGLTLVSVSINLIMNGIKIKKIIYLIIIAFLPIALIASILPVNEYAVFGMEGGVDCDGPLAVLMFSAPSFIVYGIGFLVFAKVSLKARKLKHILMLMVCVVVLVIMIPNTISVFNAYQVNSTGNRSICGPGL